MTGFVLERDYLRHDPGRGHPERPERIAVLLEAVDEHPGRRRVAARAASRDEIARVHEERHIDRVAATAGRSHFMFDADTHTSADSWSTALLAAGGVLAAVEAVLRGEVRNAFALVRPPGHHAERDRAMGFCLFNNVAVAAAALRDRHGLERVLVVDWDVHHGNGTQHIFEQDPSVLYVSTHQYPFYPGTGAATEVGSGRGRGYTVNIPLPPGCGDPEYVAAFARIVLPIARAFSPDFVLVSAGFDPHRNDPLASMQVTEAGFGALARSLLAVAEECCGGRLVAVLEGGYDTTALRDCVLTVLTEMERPETARPEPAVPSAVDDRLDSVRRIQSEWWPV